MMESMTGFSVTEEQIGSKNYRLQIKSVNHRFLELRWRAPREWSLLEVVAKEIAQKKLGRGSIEVSIEDMNKNSTLNDNESGAQKYFSKLNTELSQLEDLSFLNLPTPLRALILSQQPELWMNAEDKNKNLDIELATVCLEKLLASLKQKRLTEGSSIEKALGVQLKELNRSLEEIKNSRLSILKNIEQDYQERIRNVSLDLNLPHPTHERLLPEILILAEKKDIQEEMDRIRIHLDSFQMLIQKGESNLGKRIDFLTQELHREWTTMGNKIRDAQYSRIIIDAKMAIEKIKEQSLNLA